MNEDIKVLFIDEDADFINGLTLFLREDRCDVYSANNGKSGLEKIRVIKPDIILLDVVLPDFNGFELCKIIKSDPRTANIIVVLISSVKISSDNQAEGLESGAEGYLIKTMPVREMRARLKIFIQNKQFEKALQKSEEKYRAIFSNNSAAIAIINPDTTIVMVNDAYCSMTGYTRDEVVGMSWTQQIPPRDLERLKEYNRRRRLDPSDAPGQYEFTFYHKNGSVRDGLISVSTLPESGQIITSVSDITERKQAEEALRKSETLFTAFMDQIPGLVLIKDHELRPVYVNRTFRERLPADEWMGKTPEECFPAEEAAGMRARDEAAMAAGFERYEETWPNKNGTCSIYETRKFRIDRKGAMPLLGALIIDITDRKQAEEKNRIQLDELLRWQNIMIDREDRVQELKREVNDLCRALGRPSQYPSQVYAPENPLSINPES